VPVLAAPWPAATTIRLLAGSGAAAAFACLALVGSLQVTTPGTDVLHSMISDLVFGPHPWLFDLAVLLLIAGALAVRAALARAGLLIGSGRLLAVFAAAMTAIVAFPTCHCQVQVTASGVVHAAASLVAFTSLPLAGLRLAARHGVSRQRIATWAKHVARACLCSLAPTGLAVVPIVLAEPVSFPFGLIQRATGLLAVALLLLLAGWAWQAAAAVPDPGQPGDRGGRGRAAGVFLQP
jgi:Protein of unknown function (DUF998)